MDLQLQVNELKSKQKRHYNKNITPQEIFGNDIEQFNCSNHSSALVHKSAYYIQDKVDVVCSSLKKKFSDERVD